MTSATEEIKNKINKLMSNIEKPVDIPKRKEKKPYEGPDFIRNIMGSSAGAGSGEFHVYRHLRRKEYSRQKEMDYESKTETLDKQYQSKLESNKRSADERTAKKRLKRMKKKLKQKNKLKNNQIEKNNLNSSPNSEHSEQSLHEIESKKSEELKEELEQEISTKKKLNQFKKED